MAKAPMTREQAEAEAVKREAHKSKHQTQVAWRAVHNSGRGWHVALVPNHQPSPDGTTSLADLIFLDRALRRLGGR